MKPDPEEKMKENYLVLEIKLKRILVNLDPHYCLLVYPFCLC